MVNSQHSYISYYHPPYTSGIPTGMRTSPQMNLEIKRKYKLGGTQAILPDSTSQLRCEINLEVKGLYLSHGHIHWMLLQYLKP